MIWRSLLRQALLVLDNTVIDIEPHQWRLGGGTVLQLRYNHRMSKDIDVFFSDPQLLDYVSPTRNDALEGVMGDYAQNHLFVRYVLENGKVDFIRGNPVTQLSPEIMQFEGRMIYLDPPVEIVAKKIFYRCEEYHPRDVFDQAVVLLEEGEKDLAVFCMDYPEKAKRAMRKTRKMIEDGALELGIEALEILSGGEKARKECPAVVTDFFERIVR